MQTGDEHSQNEAAGGPGGRDLAASLEPVLGEACEGRLREVTWFRTDWQRGGAATGRARWTDATGSRAVLVKMPLHPRELRWLRSLGDADCRHVPEFVAGGETLGGYDLAWAVIEFLPHGPLALEWRPRFVDAIAEAVAGFSTAASAHPAGSLGGDEGWPDLIDRSRRKVRESKPPRAKEWNRLLRECARGLEPLLEEWRGRTPVEWIHGDLHPGNAMTRRAVEPDGDVPIEVCLIDFAEVRPGHWVEDAIYLERLHWGRPDRLEGHPPLRSIARARKAAGLDNGGDHPRLAAIRRLLMAAAAPAYARTEGSPAHLEACLEHMEHSLRTLG